MKRASLAAAAVVVLAANAFALLHAWRNRSSAPESDITLTEREIPKSYVANADDSGVGLRLQWVDQSALTYYQAPLPWLDQRMLEDVGFDTKVAATDKAAPDFYARQRPRRAFVALEFDGPSWSKWIDEAERQFPALPQQRETSSRLVAIDVGKSTTGLRSRHPDRGSVIVVPAVIGIGVIPENLKQSPRIFGTIRDLPSSIHVPLPFSVGFRHMTGDPNTAKYRVHLRYGSSLEPWVVAVETDSTPPRTQP